MRRIITLATAATIALAGAVSGLTPAAAAPADPDPSTHVAVTLSEMAIRLSVAVVPAGPVTFDITSTGAVEHELVILKTAIAEDALPANVEVAAKAAEIGHVDEIDPVLPGKTATLTVTLRPGTYVLLCNKPGHHAAGMHAALVVTTAVNANASEMQIGLSQKFALAGPVTFTYTNTGTVTHEMVILKTDLPASLIPARPADPAKVQEPGSVGEIEGVDPGKTDSLTVTLGPGNYVLLCNEPGHYAAGMRIALTVLPALSRTVSASIDMALAARGVEDLEDEDAMVDVDALLTAPGVVVTDADRAAIAAGVLPRAIAPDGTLLY